MFSAEIIRVLREADAEADKNLFKEIVCNHDTVNCFQYAHYH